MSRAGPPRGLAGPKKSPVRGLGAEELQGASGIALICGWNLGLLPDRIFADQVRVQLITPAEVMLIEALLTPVLAVWLRQVRPETVGDQVFT